MFETRKDVKRATLQDLQKDQRLRGRLYKFTTARENRNDVERDDDERKGDPRRQSVRGRRGRGQGEIVARRVQR